MKSGMPYKDREPFQLITNNAGFFHKSSAELRTTEMPRFSAIDLGYAYESCLFTENDSEVQARYQTLGEAIAGHQTLCRKFNLKTDIE